MSASPTYLFYRTPSLRWFSRRLPRHWLFQLAVAGVAFVSFFVSPERRASVRPLFTVLTPRFSRERVHRAAEQFLILKTWRQYLTWSWPVWYQQHDQWVEFNGEEHLAAALEQGRGALLLSGHSFGFERFIAPVLAQKGYVAHRAGEGWDGRDLAERWGSAPYASWQYLRYGHTSMERIQALKRMHDALGRKEIVHVTLRGMPKGEAQFEMPFWYKQFFLDGQFLKSIPVLKAPVLPCFSVMDETGKIQVNIYPAIEPNPTAVMKSFAPLYLNYLERFPELSRIWKRVLAQREHW